MCSEAQLLFTFVKAEKQHNICCVSSLFWVCHCNQKLRLIFVLYYKCEHYTMRWFQKSLTLFAESLKCIGNKHLDISINLLLQHVGGVCDRISMLLGISYINSGYIFCKQSHLLPCTSIVLLWNTKIAVP